MSDERRKLFDKWAESFDDSMEDPSGFPHEGYERVLDLVADRAGLEPGMAVLDLGIGTGNLAGRLLDRGCRVWGLDFSLRMLAKVHEKYPQIELLKADIRGDWPIDVDQRFDRVVSAYVLHEFDLGSKVRLLGKLVREHLAERGRVVVGDISFTTRGARCNKVGVCGKKPDVAALQDLLVHSLKGLSSYAVEGRKVGVVDSEADEFTASALFSTLTNVNFDAENFGEFINRSVELRKNLKAKVKNAGGNTDINEDAAQFTPAASLDEMIKQGEATELTPHDINPDIASLEQTVLYGLKGAAAYAYHARILGQKDDEVYAYMHEALSSMLNKDLSLEDWVALALKCGEINLKTMGLLDAGNTGKYGHPVPTEVPLGAKKGKALLVSGHDLHDLEEILKQTEGKDITIYTHGEMLPTHAYPELKKYTNFYGHYGTAWQNQHREFATFPGAIVMTTNCLQKPADSYKDNVFTCGVVGWPGVAHINNNDFTPAIEKALALPGFSDDAPGKTVMTGFARNAVLGVADKVIEGVKAGAIKHFFLVAGCDGAKPGRNYYTEFVEKVPEDCVVMTLACGKFRFFDKDLGNIGGIPRLLDIGQCNDAYSAIQIAVALSEAFNVGVNELPLSMVLSWYEQKAVAILLTLLHLGIKGIRLGPTLPAFITPNVLDLLVKNFDIKPITTPDKDLADILNPDTVTA